MLQNLINILKEISTIDISGFSTNTILSFKNLTNNQIQPYISKIQSIFSINTNALTHLLDLIAKTGPVGAIGFTGLSVGITAFMKNLDYPVRLYGYGA